MRWKICTEKRIVRRWVPIAMLGGFFTANACLIIADCAADPTDCNLWPFEFVMIAAATSPAFIGAGVSGLLRGVSGFGGGVLTFNC
jgi:hypothetical protein